MITFSVETLDQCLPEIEPLLQGHFEEVGANRAQLGYPNMDKSTYYAVEARGGLHIVVARSLGAIVGYYVAFVNVHLHYAHSLTALTDVYYIHPDHRKGSVGIKLFKEAERTLKARGVQRIFSGTKKSKDMSKLFEFLGWTHNENLFVKWIGD